MESEVLNKWLNGSEEILFPMISGFIYVETSEAGFSGLIFVKDTNCYEMDYNIGVGVTPDRMLCFKRQEDGNISCRNTKDYGIGVRLSILHYSTI